MNLERIVFLGTAGPIPSATRDSAGLLLDFSQDTLLVDCPHQTTKALLTLDISPVSVRWMFLTHSHIDHIAGLPPFLQTCQLQGRVSPLEIFASQETFAVCQELLQVFEEQIAVKIIWHKVFPFSLTELASGVKLKFFQVQHIAGSLGIRVESGGLTVVISGDTELCASTLLEAGDADILIHECSNASFTRLKGHSSPEEVGEIAEKAGVKQLYLVHLAQEFLHNIEVVVERVKTKYKGYVCVPPDLMELNCATGIRKCFKHRAY